MLYVFVFTNLNNVIATIIKKNIKRNDIDSKFSTTFDVMFNYDPKLEANLFITKYELRNIVHNAYACVVNCNKSHGFNASRVLHRAALALEKDLWVRKAQLIQNILKQEAILPTSVGNGIVHQAINWNEINCALERANRDNISFDSPNLSQEDGVRFLTQKGIEFKGAPRDIINSSSTTAVGKNASACLYPLTLVRKLLEEDFMCRLPGGKKTVQNAMKCLQRSLVDVSNWSRITQEALNFLSNDDGSVIRGLPFGQARVALLEQTKIHQKICRRKQNKLKKKRRHMQQVLKQREEQKMAEKADILRQRQQLLKKDQEAETNNCHIDKDNHRQHYEESRDEQQVDKRTSPVRALSTAVVSVSAAALENITTELFQNTTNCHGSLSVASKDSTSESNHDGIGINKKSTNKTKKRCKKKKYAKSQSNKIPPRSAKAALLPHYTFKNWTKRKQKNQ